MLVGWLRTALEIDVFQVQFQSGDTQTADYKSTSTEECKRDASREYHNESHKMKKVHRQLGPTSVSFHASHCRR